MYMNLCIYFHHTTCIHAQTCTYNGIDRQTDIQMQVFLSGCVAQMNSSIKYFRFVHGSERVGDY